MFWAKSFIFFLLLGAGQGSSKKSISYSFFQLDTHHELAEILRLLRAHTFRLMVYFSTTLPNLCYFATPTLPISAMALSITSDRETDSHRFKQAKREFMCTYKPKSLKV